MQKLGEQGMRVFLVSRTKGTKNKFNAHFHCHFIGFLGGYFGMGTFMASMSFSFKKAEENVCLT
jgi:hypothetical protein